MLGIIDILHERPLVFDTALGFLLSCGIQYMTSYFPLLVATSKPDRIHLSIDDHMIVAEN